MKLSIYSTCYFLRKNKFPYLENIKNFSLFADDVVIATNEEGASDGTLDMLQNYVKTHNLLNVKIVVSKNIVFSQSSFDGALKNFALSETIGDICIQMDLDEQIPLWQKERWTQVGEILLNSHYDAIMVPSIDLWGNKKSIRQDNLIGQKFRIHKPYPYLRIGILDRAKLSNGLIDTSISDTCDLINSYTNETALAALSCPQECLNPKNSSRLNNHIFTLHFGFLDLKYKAELARIWWEEKWKDRSGRDNNCIIEARELEKASTVEHFLRLE